MTSILSGCRRRFIGMSILLLVWEGHVLRVHANPAGGTVTQGSATFSTAGSQFTISQTSANAFINWQTFNIAAGETTTFNQPSASSVTWNYIYDPNNPTAPPSAINGNINAIGYVVLQNPNGFTVGGSATITAHGLIMTTASTPAFNLSSGGPWSFNTPPPAAKIVNYGQINIVGGGTAFLIAADIENGIDPVTTKPGTISAPGGKIGLYAGQTVLVSTSPDGRGLSAQVTLPQGSVDNEGNLIADAGSVALHAQVVNQNGLIQANSAQNVNGTIELVASDSLNLGANSDIEAHGDNGSANASPGGFVVLKSDNTFADTAGSIVDVAGGTGASGGQAGIVEVFGNNVADASTIQSTIDTLSAAQFSLQNHLFVNPNDIAFSSSASVASSEANINVADLSGYTRIDLHALNNIVLSTLWALTDLSVPATLNLTAGNDVNLNNSIVAGNNWSMNLTAGAGFTPSTAQPKPKPGNDGIYLNGSSFIQARNGGIDLYAPNEVIVNSGAIRTIGIGGINGGNIDVTAEYGNVNTGTSTSGFNFLPAAPFYTPFSLSGFGTTKTINYNNSNLGGISTAGGGDVTVNAGGDVISHLPIGSDSSTVNNYDAGAGAFGSQPGNVTITAGGSVYGHYVVVNGTGTITAGQNIGNASQNVALSLVTGSWSLDAPNGNIYLQEVRNPNGVFNSLSATGSHLFDYDLQASVDLTAGNGVYLTGQNLPRPNGTVPLLMPPTLDITAGSGGVALQTPTPVDSSGKNIALTVEYPITLFPSAYGDLQIITTDGGGFSAAPGTVLLMSDSAQKQWFVANSGTQPFSEIDHGNAPVEMNNYNPVIINIAGSVNNVILWTDKATQITVGGDMSGCSFYGQNLHASDVTSITVAGQISNPGFFNSVTLDQGLQNLPTADLPPGMVNTWYLILQLAVDPNSSYLQIPSNIAQSGYASYVNQAALLPGVAPLTSLAYDSNTKTLTAIGPIPQNLLSALEGPLYVVRYNNGIPDTTPYVDPTTGKTYYQVMTDKIDWSSSDNPKQFNEITALAAASQTAPPLGTPAGSYFVGGTGQFNVNADSISLGNAYGIVSLGNGQLKGTDYSYLTSLLQTEPGATINVTVTGDLDMLSSTIAALGSGGVNVTSTGGSMDLGSQQLIPFLDRIMNGVSGDNIGLGIYTSGGGNVNVTAQGTINIDSSRIATFNGGDVNIESLTGDVLAGSGGTITIPINVFSPFATGLHEPFEKVYVNGIAAETLTKPSAVPGSASAPGNITVITPQGSIHADLGGIKQEALNGTTPSGPTITLEAGTPGPGGFGSSDPPVYVGDIDLGTVGVIGETVIVKFTGTISGLVISRHNASVVGQTVGSSLTVLAGGTANISVQSSGGNGSGITIIGGQGVNASGIGSGATLLGQNVSVNGGAAQSTLGTSASATSTSQSAAGQASSDTQQQVASNDTNDDEKKKKKKSALVRGVERVTVILPKAS